MEQQPYLTIVIPCYNERENILGGVLEEVYAYLKNSSLNWEMIISDDGSTDDSRELILQFAQGKSRIRLLANPHGGKPSAIKYGIQEAKGDYLLFTDLDQSTPLAEVEKLTPFFGTFEAVIGSRRDRKNFPLYRRIGSGVFKLFRQTLLLRNINDTQCGFKAFKTSLLRDIFPKLEFFQTSVAVKGWTVTSFDVELLHLIEQQGKQIKEVIVDWEDRDLAKGKQKSYFKESADMLRQILRVKRNDLMKKYKCK